jgi:hypothetical protein
MILKACSEREWNERRWVEWVLRKGPQRRYV